MGGGGMRAKRTAASARLTGRGRAPDARGMGDERGEREREAIMARPRPRRDRPIAPRAPEARRRLPLLHEARPVDRAVRPVLAVWEITLACDLACRHCGSRAGRARPDELTTAEALDLVDQLAELGVFEVTLIGGEAYLREDWLEIVRRIRARGMTPLLTTGGRGLTRERAEAAAAAGLASASVSIDGLAASHDRLRGVPGSHAAALAALAHLRAAGVRVSVNTQINRLSLPELPAVLDTVIASGAHSWQIQLTVAMGRAADEPEVLLQPYDLLELFPLLGALAARCRAADVLLWPGNNVGYFGPFESTLRGTLARGHMLDCGAGRSGIGIEADGTVKGCPSLATARWAGGNVRDERLVDIWERAAPLRYTRERGVESLWGFCAGCYYAEVCQGGCTWTAESLLGRPGNNPMCHHRALELARAGQRERLVQVQPAPGLPFDEGRFELVVEPGTVLRRS
jgi:radical SAM protein with 4Fe4S-binding SPASM domain